MYHPMLTLAVAQTRLDDLERELRHRSRAEVARAGFDTQGRFARLSRRRTRYAAPATVA